MSSRLVARGNERARLGRSERQLCCAACGCVYGIWQPRCGAERRDCCLPHEATKAVPVAESGNHAHRRYSTGVTGFTPEPALCCGVVVPSAATGSSLLPTACTEPAEREASPSPRCQCVLRTGSHFCVCRTRSFWTPCDRISKRIRSGAACGPCMHKKNVFRSTSTSVLLFPRLSLWAHGPIACGSQDERKKVVYFIFSKLSKAFFKKACSSRI